MKYTSLTPLKKLVNVSVSIPGSKSYTNRALIMAALTRNPVTIKNALESDDTDAMIDCLDTLGISVQKKGTEITVSGSIDDVTDTTYNLSARLSGTTIRFILALCCIVPGIKTVQGVGRLNERPIKDLVDGLRSLGATIEYTSQEGFPPLRVTSGSLKQHTVTISGGVSSQYFSALLMIAPVVGGLTIKVSGEQISKSYIDMTIDMMKAWGVRVENQNYRTYIVIPGQTYKMLEYVVEGDYSGAGYFAAAAVLTGSSITMNNLNPESSQGDLQFIRILELMGNRVEYRADSVTVYGNSIKACTVDMEQCPDQAQTLAVIAAFAPGKTTMTGVRSLRVKETERVRAIQNELAKMGIKTESPDADTLIVHGGNPNAAIIDTYGDHRMAMSFAVAGSRIPGIIITDPSVVNKTFPSFWEQLQKIGVTMTYGK